MADDVLNLMPVRSGHFILESGYHTDVWFNLDSLFVSPRRIAPLVTALSKRLGGYKPTAVCGPQHGGAFLAQAVAAELGLNFYYTLPQGGSRANGLFAARYELPAGLKEQASNERFAIVDDVISAGSSVRATHKEVTDAGGEVVAVGGLVLLGTRASDYFATLGIPIEAIAQREFETWTPDRYLLCRRGEPLEDPNCSLIADCRLANERIITIVNWHLAIVNYTTRSLSLPALTLSTHYKSCFERKLFSALARSN